LFADVRPHAPGDLGLQVDDCVFTGNAAQDGGALHVADFMLAGQAPRLVVTGSTFSGNTAIGRGGALFVSRQGTASVANSILWGDTAASGIEIHVTGSGSSASVAWSDVQGGLAGVVVAPASSLAWLAGNIAVDPSFAGPELRLGPGSPCADAGDNTSIPPDRADVDGDGNLAEPVPLDLDRTLRRKDDPAVPNTGNGTPPIVDLGAFERRG
jgi:predicted outer membrane repeat protein